MKKETVIKRINKLDLEQARRILTHFLDFVDEKDYPLFVKNMEEALDISKQEIDERFKEFSKFCKKVNNGDLYLYYCEIYDREYYGDYDIHYRDYDKIGDTLDEAFRFTLKLMKQKKYAEALKFYELMLHLEISGEIYNEYNPDEFYSGEIFDFSQIDGVVNFGYYEFIERGLICAFHVQAEPEKIYEFAQHLKEKYLTNFFDKYCKEKFNLTNFWPNWKKYLLKLKKEKKEDFLSFIIDYFLKEAMEKVPQDNEKIALDFIEEDSTYYCEYVSKLKKLGKYDEIYKTLEIALDKMEDTHSSNKVELLYLLLETKEALNIKTSNQEIYQNIFRYKPTKENFVVAFYHHAFDNKGDYLSIEPENAALYDLFFGDFDDLKEKMNNIHGRDLYNVDLYRLILSYFSNLDDEYGEAYKTLTKYIENFDESQKNQLCLNNSNTQNQQLIALYRAWKAKHVIPNEEEYFAFLGTRVDYYLDYVLNNKIHDLYYNASRIARLYAKALDARGKSSYLYIDSLHKKYVYMRKFRELLRKD